MKIQHDQLADWLNIGLRSLVMTAVFMLNFVTTALAEPQQTETARDEKFLRDREAILAMEGDFFVSFSFRETVSFMDGYELKEPYTSKGHETVRVIRDDGDFISLQHILVVDGIFKDQMPIKHWRQDWIFEPTQLFEYAGDHVWRVRSVDEAESGGKWAQLVYQVDDSPRYAAVAEWTHQYGVSVWDSPPTWRPLPRRERTKRDDYDVLISRNRHALTPDGWVHEQDSSKIVLGKEPQVLAREIGVNTYISSKDFEIQVAEDYWDQTRDFWAEVRAEWRKLYQQSGVFEVNPSGPSGKLYNQILLLAKERREGTLDVEKAVARARDLIRASTSRHIAESKSPIGVQDKKFYD